MARPSDWSPVDMDSDPTPGDPERIRELAEELQTFADDVGEALSRINGMAGDDVLLRWAGRSAEAFRGEFDGVPPNLRKLQTSYDLCAQALNAYWPKLQNAQGMADRALAQARTAQGDLTAAQSALTDAQDWVSRAGDEAERLQDEEDSPEAPSESEVRSAVRDHQAAQQAASSAQSRVDDAQERLDAARELARQARDLREEAAQTCARGIDEASDAGIQNRRWWEDAIDWVRDNWDTIVEICKVIVAVVGIVAMIIGGPLALLVLAAALVVLADTLIKYSQGRASLWDVAFAALDCIPGMKGITTLGGLARGIRSVATTGLRGLRQGVLGLGRTLRRNGRPSGALFCRTDPIDMATGDVVMEAFDVELPGVLPLTLRRHHRSGFRHGMRFGPSWTSPLDQRLLLDDAGLQFVTDDGMVLDYPRPLRDTPVLPVEGPRWELTWDGVPGAPITIHQRRAGLTLHFAPVAGRPASELPLVAVTDRNGNRITVVHDEAGAPRELRHSGGYRVGLRVAGGRVEEVRLLSAPGEPVLVRYGYDDRGDLTEIHTSADRPLRFFYDDAHRITGWLDRNGSRYAYRYDEQGRCHATDGTEGVLASRITYDADTHRTVFTDSLGHSTVYQFNDGYQLLTETDPLGNHTRREWDRHDHLLSLTDPLGHVTRYTYDEHGHVVAVVDPEGGRTETRVNAFGLVTRVTDADGAVWTREYDERGNVLRVTDPAGAVEQFAYDERGAMVRRVDATGRVYTFENDAAGLHTRLSGPDGLDLRYHRDAFGRVVAITRPGEVAPLVRLSWSVEGALVSRTLADGRTERWRHDGEGNVREHVDVAGRRTRHTIGVFDQVTETETPGGARWQRRYDSELRLVAVVNPAGLTSTYEYDAAGRLIGETDFSGRRTRYAYDAAGRRVEQTNGAGQRLRRTFNARGDLVAETTGARTATFAYTAAGVMTRAVNEDADITFVRDAAGRILEERCDGRTLTFRYDAAGRTVYRRTPAGAESHWEWTDADLPRTLRAGQRTIGFAHAPDNGLPPRETTRHLPGGGRVEQTWDDLGQLTEQCLTRGDRPVRRRVYDYGPAGRLRSLSETAGLAKADPLRVETDADLRVTAIRGGGRPEESYEYDASGTIVRARTGGGEPGERPPVEYLTEGVRLRRAGRVRYEYDEQGRVVRQRRHLPSGGVREWRYTWDADDRLTDVVTPDGGHWRYRYDPLGRRIAKQRLAGDGTVLEESRFVWDGVRVAERTRWHAESGETRTTTWDWHPGSHRPVAQRDRGGLRSAPQEDIDERFHAIVTDLVGTPTELVDESGAITWQARPTLTGRLPDGEAGGAADCPLRFPGQYHDAETGLHYSLYRYYDPATGWYLSPDPLGVVFGSDHPYRYVDDPFLLSDPLGLAPCVAQTLSQRASAFSALAPQIVRERFQTVAVVRVRTPRGEVDLVAASGDGLLPAQRAMVDPNRVPPEYAVPNVPGLHAEHNAILFATVMGFDLVAGGASRQVCPEICAPIIRGLNGRVTGALVGPGETMPRTFEW
jgi:RHS repeat-associated protein